MALAKDTGFSYKKPDPYEELKKEVQQIKQPKPSTSTYTAPTAAQEVAAARKEQIAINNTPIPTPTTPTPAVSKPSAPTVTGITTTIPPTATAAEKPIEETKPINTLVEQPITQDEGPSIQDMIQQMNDAVKSDDPPHYHPNMVQLSEEEMSEPIITEKAE